MNYSNDPTIDYPELDSNDDPDGDYYDRVYEQGFDDGYGIGRYEHALAQDTERLN